MRLAIKPKSSIRLLGSLNNNSDTPIAQYLRNIAIAIAHKMSVFHEAPGAPKVDIEMEDLFTKGGNMRGTVVAAALLALIFTGSGFAMESKKSSNPSATTIEQRKAQRLKDLDKRMKKLQQEKACVKAATSSDDLDSCAKKQADSSGKKAASKQTGKADSSAKPGKAKSSAQGVLSEPDDEAAE